MSKSSEFTELQLEDMRYLRNYSLEMLKEKYDTIKRAVNLTFILNSGALVYIPVYLEGNIDVIYLLLGLPLFFLISGVTSSLQAYWHLSYAFSAQSDMALSDTQNEKEHHLEISNKEYKKAYVRCWLSFWAFIFSFVVVIYGMPLVTWFQ